MDLSLSDEQEMLRDAVARYVREKHGPDVRRDLRDTENGYSADVWSDFAEMSWLALPVSSENGGLGGTAIDEMIVLREFGRGLVAEPYLVNVVICAGLLEAIADQRQRVAQLHDLISGRAQWAFAFAESATRHSWADVALSAELSGSHYVLNGQKLTVLNGHAADRLIVLARTSGSPGDGDGLSLFQLPVQTSGVAVEGLLLVDGTKGATISFDGVSVPSNHVVGPLDGAIDVVQAVADRTLVAMGAEGLGAVEALLDLTIQHLTNREQFGKPLADFQALQHRIAEMYVATESLRSMVTCAAIAHAESREDRGLWSSAVKVKLSQVGRYVSQQAVQLHGAIGTTDELAVGHYYKRLMLLSVLFGPGDFHLRRFAAGRR